MENKMKNTNIDCIGAIPIEWDVKPLKYLVRQPITDGPHETPEFTESGVPFLSVDGIQKGKLIFENTRFVSEYDANRYDLKVKPEFNDILLGKAASIGKVAIVDIGWHGTMQKAIISATNNADILRRISNLEKIIYGKE